MVTFTDIVSCWGGSSGRGPCRLTTGSSAVASALSSGPGAAIVSSRSSSTAGPQVLVWWLLLSDSEMVGDSARYSVRLTAEI